MKNNWIIYLVSSVSESEPPTPFNLILLNLFFCDSIWVSVLAKIRNFSPFFFSFVLRLYLFFISLKGTNLVCKKREYESIRPYNIVVHSFVTFFRKIIEKL